MIFFFDIDGTLMVHDNDKSYIPRSTKEALDKLRNLGYRVVIATGRNYLQTQNVLNELNIYDAVLCDGATIIVNGEIVEETYFDKATANNIVRQIHKNKVPCTAHNAHKNYVVYENSHLKEFLMGTRRNGNKEFIQNIPEDNNYATFAVFNDYEFQNIDNAHYEKYPIGGVIYQKGISKASGIKSFLKHNKIENKQVYVFGDSFNDKEMFEEFYENSYVMGNAKDEVKVFAKNIIGDIKQDGISITINKILSQK